MKRILPILLILLLLCGCASEPEITPEEIIAAYEAAGYTVWSGTYEETLEQGQIAYIQAENPDGEYIYFSVFNTPEEAKAYKEEFYHPVMLGLFSAIFGDPSWHRCQVHGCIMVEYDEPEFYKIFEDLLKSK